MKIIDLFCGCGGFSLGFDYLEEYEIIYALDDWETACQSYRANFPYVDVDCRDAVTVKPHEVPQCDVIIGGPPCQEFTVAKARGGDTRTFDTTFIDWFLAVIDIIKPTYWIMENVPAVKNVLSSTVMHHVVKMTDYGVPQLRRRMFAGKYQLPKSSKCEVVFPTVINEAGGFTYRPPNLGIRLGAVFRRRSLLHEMKLVQTFPLDYVLHGSLNEQYTQLGNAVPPLMAFHLADSLLQAPQQRLI